LDDNTKIFPNPVEDALTLQTNITEAQSAEIQIVALNGAIIQSMTRDLPKGISQTKINTQDLDTGFYLLRIKTTDGIAVKKLTKF
jgi:Secretion system C-terminal sorting domain